MRFPRSALALVLALSALGAAAAGGSQGRPAALAARARRGAPLATRGGGAVAAQEAPQGGLPAGAKLLIGAGGIYAAFMYYGLLMEDVFAYRSESGEAFAAVWFLQVLEALANVVIGGIGMKATGATPNLPLKLFAMTGASQVSAKALTTLALAKGVSFPVLMLAKSAKMVPVMIGSLLLGGATYSLREYLQVAMIIGGTCMVSMAKKKKKGAGGSAMGLVCIMGSLVCDGLTGGIQKRLKNEARSRGADAKPYDFMFHTNFYMMLSAAAVALVNGQLLSGAAFCAQNPMIFDKIWRFALCSAFGQTFIFYTIANFDPLVCTTVTTTRKIFSVLLSIFLKGHQLNAQGWTGVAIASSGILGELENKASKAKKKKAD